MKNLFQLKKRINEIWFFLLDFRSKHLLVDASYHSRCHSSDCTLKNLTAQWPWMPSIGQNLQPFTGNGDVSIWVKTFEWNGTSPQKTKQSSVYNGHLRGPVTLKSTAERLAVELSLSYLRLRSLAPGIRTPILPLAGRTL